MTTNWCSIESVIQGSALVFETGASGFKLMIEHPDGDVMKWFFDKEKWEELKDHVDAILRDYEARVDA